MSRMAFLGANTILLPTSSVVNGYHPRRKSPIADNILYNFPLSSSSPFSSSSMDASYCLIAIWHADNRRKYQSCQYNLYLCTYFFVADPSFVCYKKQYSATATTPV